MTRGNLPGAAQALAEALQTDPLNPQALHLLGWVTFQQGREQEGIDLMDRSIASAPRVGAFYCNLGEAYRRCGRIDDALTLLGRAAVLSPNSPETWHNLGLVYAEKLDYQRAIDCYSKAIAFRADYANAYFSRALARLTIGEFKDGWEDYEWRWRTASFVSQLRSFRHPTWQGEPLTGKKLLVWVEQGFGDALMAARLISLLEKLGAHVLWEVPGELFTLMQAGDFRAELFRRGDVLPPFDLHVPMMSLWRLLHVSVETIHETLPTDSVGGWKSGGAYLRSPVDPRWASLISDSPGVLRAGLVWAGQTQHINDRNRSCPPAAMAMLDEVAGVEFYSLQKNASVETVPLDLTDLSPHLADFAATARAIARLDVVITVDTSVAHLAGGMGKPTLVMLPYAPDWRWLLDRDDSPWYPSVRLFRQAARGNWAGVMKDVTGELITMVRSKNAKRLAGG